MKIKIITAIYFAIGSINIATGIIGAADANQLSKAALMPILIYFIFSLANGVITLPRLILAVGLIFSWGGDIILSISQEPMYFIGGLGLFLIAQLAYSFVMFKSTFASPKITINPILPVVIYGLVLLGVVLPKAGSLTIPIILYALCILAMLSSSRFRKSLTTDDSYRLTLIGAFLFVISDSLIAVNRFVFDIPFASAYIMSTYIAAQYLIVKGIMAHPGG